jgi:hypothetical protein
MGRNPHPGQLDYMDLFNPGAPWQVAARHVQVFMVTTQFVDHATDEQLAHVINGLKARGISLGMAGLMLAPSRRCGSGVESYGRAFVMDRVASRITQLGGRLDYVAFDEPVWFAHRLAGPRHCQDSLADIASQMIEPARALKTAFPALSFADTEPLNNQTDASLLADILDFATEFQKKTGYRIDAVHADIIWRDDWRAQYGDWYRALKARGIRVGAICRGSAADKSDEEWTEEAVRTVSNLTGDGAARPDVIRIQTWNAHPTRMLPDSDPATLTSVVREAFGP